MGILQNFKSRFGSSNEKASKKTPTKQSSIDTELPRGRVSSPEDETPWANLKNLVKLVQPTFNTDLIPMIRNLYKINPDVGIAVQDMFKLANTEHIITFTDATAEQEKKMRSHLDAASKTWLNYTAGTHGLVNRLIVQLMVSGSISFETVPKRDLSGLENIVLIKPESILFRRDQRGNYHPYQVIHNKLNRDPIKLNLETYCYLSMYNDTDEPYGVPPFITALDSLNTQSDMKSNLKTVTSQLGLLGFLKASLAKTAKKGSESDAAYESRLNRNLSLFKDRILEGMKDGVIVGFEDDHEFEFNSTTKNLANIDTIYNMNQQSVANGLGISGNLIGISGANTEGGAGIMLSKVISQLKNIHMFVAYALEKIYSLELKLAGFDCKGVKVKFATSTVSDELKVQQGKEIKLRNLTVLYQQGIINNTQYAFEAGYDKADKPEPRIDPMAVIKDQQKKEGREKDKDVSDRSKRDKDKTNPKRADQDTKKRVQ